MKIAMTAAREQFPLSPMKVTKKTIIGTFGFLAWLLVVYAITWVWLIMATGKFAFPLTTLGFVGVVPIIIVLDYLYQRWYFAAYFYDLNPDYLVIRKGTITSQEITVPYERFQDVYVDQDILDRMFGLYDVHIASASISSGMEAHIDGVGQQAAESLRILLLQKLRERMTRKGETQNIPVQPRS